MVSITNGINTFRVTSGAVKVYESMGFHVVSDEESEYVKQENFNDSGVPVFVAEDTEGYTGEREYTEEDDNNGISDEDATFVEEILEKPLSQWTNDEVKEFVRIKNIDTSGVQKVSQVRAIIKAYLEEEQKNA